MSEKAVIMSTHLGLTLAKYCDSVVQLRHKLVEPDLSEAERRDIKFLIKIRGNDENLRI